MTPEFAQLVEPIIQSVLTTVRQIERGTPVQLELERDRIRDRLLEAEREAVAGSARIGAEQFELAKKCLVYWADEVLTYAAEDWKNITLEFDFYNTHDHAWKFYVEGETQARHSSPDIVELWYLAMALGFRGDIRDAFKNHLKRDMPGNAANPDDARHAWARELEARIRHNQPPDLAGEPLVGHVNPLSGRTWLNVALVVLLFAAAFCGAVFYRTGF